jgi:ubiquinone/menaquinone biosynthesis C-methylase UbiE
LPKSVAYLPAPAQLVDMLQQAGFEHVRHEQLSGGLTQLMHATKR